MNAAALADDVLPRLLSQIGLSAKSAIVSRHTSGGNNDIFEVDVDGQRFAMKRYGRRWANGRDGMMAEWQFLRFAETAGINGTPRPFAVDEHSDTALYEFVDGQKPEADDIGDDAVRRVADFVNALNTASARESGAELPDASESAFSVEGHLRVLEGRWARLRECDVDCGIDGMLKRLEDVVPRLRDQLTHGCEAMGISLTHSLPADERVISPSDLGFHNVLQASDGGFVFLDFEYAGWDDPAKLVADFYYQPALPAPRATQEMFINRALPRLADSHRERLRLLTPLFGLRWCFIILNPFLRAWVADNAERIDRTALGRIRGARLENATALLDSVEGMIERSRPLLNPAFHIS